MVASLRSATPEISERPLQFLDILYVLSLLMDVCVPVTAFMR